MTQRKPYTVKNNRPRRHVSLYGRVLSPKGGRVSMMDLTEEELLKDACARVLRVGRVKLVRAPSVVPQAVADLAGALPEGTSVATAAPTSSPEPAPQELNDAEEAAEVDKEAVEETPAEAGEEGTPEGAEGDGDGADVSEASDAEAADAEDEPVIDPLTDTSKVWSEAELFALNTADQKTILRSRSLKVGGKEADRVDRILDAQAS